jgi:hypothetical protein
VVNGKFCAHCGQKARVGRISLANLLNEISDSVLQVNRGFFYTLIQLSSRPGNTLADYLDGRRKSHFKPVAYLLVLSTLYFFIAQWFDQSTMIDDIFMGWLNRETELNPGAELPGFASWLLSHYAYLALLLVPVFSLSSYIAFYTFKKNYLEHLVVNCYITGHLAVIYSLFIVGGTVAGSDLMKMLSYFAAFTYTFWVFTQLFSKGSTWMNILRVILTYLIYLLLSAVLLVALMTIN